MHAARNRPTRPIRLGRNQASLGFLSLSAVAAILVGLARVPAARAEPASVALPADPALIKLIQESLSARHDLARARAVIRASQHRLPQAGALPDPMLQVGIQNDGFTSIEIGRMETSYISLMASQAFPWPGKLDLQENIAELEVADARNGLLRALLSTEAEVRRAYLELLLVRDRLALLEQLESLWRNTSALARISYESGGGSQTDMLRAQLELQRLKQRRVGLRAQELARLHALNRLRNQPLSRPVETELHVKELPPLARFRSLFSAEQALARNPELASARVSVTRAEKRHALAEKSYYPDLTVGAGVMFRGQLPPMWQVTLGGPVPVFAASRQGRAAQESRAWGSAAHSQVAELSQLIRLRSKERETAFGSVLDSMAIYEQGLLAQSEATAQSALNQYRVGKGSFVAVLEANAGYIVDQEEYLQLLVSAHRILIAEAELSLSATDIPSGGAAENGMPGAAQASMPTATGGLSVTSAPASASGPPSGM